MKRTGRSRSKSKETMTSPRLILLCASLLISISLVVTGAILFSDSTPKAEAAAQIQNGVSPEALAQIEALIREKESRTGVQTKMDSQLIYELKMARGQAIADGVAELETDLEYTDKGQVELDIKATVTAGLLSQLKASGAEIVSAIPAENSVRISADIDQVESIAALPDVIFVQPRQGAMTSGLKTQKGRRQSTETTDARPFIEFDVRTENARNLPPGFSRRAGLVRRSIEELLANAAQPNVGGSVPPTGVGSRSSEGDLTHRAFSARGAFHADGTGIKIGVLSDGVTNLAASQALGDLGPVTVLAGQAGSGDEGTAMLEIVHDLAPGAQLFFATALGGITNFAQNIRNLRTAGCDIIVDDVFYFVETPFQDGQAPTVVSNTNGGVVIQAVNDVTASGALYFSSAGNSGNKNDNTAGTWEGDFVDGGATGAPLPVGNLHNFGGQNFNTLTVANTTAPISLYWSDPLGGSSNDYDLFRLNAAGTAIAASSANIQNGTQDPYEQISQSTLNPRIVIVKKTGAAARFLHLNGNRGRFSITTGGSTHGHSSAANAFSCAATPAVGPFPNPHSGTDLSETFTSDGPRRIFFQADGTPITPGNFLSTGGLLRQKPDITAADGVSVTGVGGFPSPFFGTSASAPHAAAIAGLLKSAVPAATPAQIRTALISSAIDIEIPGVDRDTGAGIITAIGAMQALGAAGTPYLEFVSITANEDPGDGNGAIDAGDGANLIISLRNAGPINASMVSATLASSTPGVTVHSPNSSAYPDLAALGGTGANVTPYRFTLASNIPCPTTLNFTLTATYTGGGSPQVLNFTVTSGPPTINIATTLDATAPPTGPGFTSVTDNTQNARIFRDGIISTCAAPKAVFPGTTAPGNRRFDAYSFTTCPTAPLNCVTVTLSGTNAINLFTAAYLGSYNPTNIGQNYLADPGTSAASRTYSFNIPAGTQTFVVVVHEVTAGAGSGTAYNLTVSGSCVGACAPANQVPVAICQNVTVSADGTCTANASINNGSSDADGDSLTITQTPSGPYPLGTTSVLLTVRDPRGATAQCTGTVTVVDTNPPTITCPANITASNTPNQCGAVVNYPAATASDNCAGSLTPVCSPASGSFFPVGTTTVTCTVGDGANPSSCSFTVKVNDTQPPTITCPPNQTAVTALPGQASTVVSYPASTASDNCPGVSAVCNPPSGSAFSAGTTTVTCTATDGSGNTASCSFTVTVFNVRVQDESSGAVLLWNSVSGEYRFCCGGGFYTGAGTSIKQGSTFTLQHIAGDRRVMGRVDATFVGSASLQSPPGSLRCTLTDRNVRNDTAFCP